MANWFKEDLFMAQSQIKWVSLWLLVDYPMIMIRKLIFVCFLTYSAFTDFIWVFQSTNRSLESRKWNRYNDKSNATKTRLRCTRKRFTCDMIHVLQIIRLILDNRLISGWCWLLCSTLVYQLITKCMGLVSLCTWRLLNQEQRTKTHICLQSGIRCNRGAKSCTTGWWCE